MLMYADSRRYLLRALTASCLLITACSDPETSQNAAEPVAAASEEPAGSIVEEAADFVKRHPPGGTYSNTDTENGVETRFSSIWSITNMNLGRTWSWHYEANETGAGSGPNMKASHVGDFSVDPRLLSLPVTVERQKQTTSIALECFSDDCIEARGTDEISFASAEMPSTGPTPMKSPIGRLIWEYDDQDEAERVAKALTILLREAGAKERQF